VAAIGTAEVVTVAVRETFLLSLELRQTCVRAEPRASFREGRLTLNSLLLQCIASGTSSAMVRQVYNLVAPVGTQGLSMFGFWNFRSVSP
jgi:hypothetical protein